MFDDTIAALATPLGEGGLAVIRISGSRALAVVDRCFIPAGRQAPPLREATTHTLHYGHVMRDGQRVDEVLVAVLRAPRTFTREDTVEISCHGGMLVARTVLDTVLAAGARPAQPGEFTRRAFLNGRLDLAQAEAVAEVIQARSELALQAANAQLAGHLSRRINQLRDDLMHTLAHVEADLDFPEEDIAPHPRAALLARLERSVVFMDELLRTATEGQLLRRGIRAAIVGRPNVGKSSLLNQLLGRDRAIVSARPGTTRDTIEETANIRGLPVVLVDTAGLREARDEIEQEGIRRSYTAVAQAELILRVVDLSAPAHPEDLAFLAGVRSGKCVVIGNKADLPRQLEWPASALPLTEVSCLDGRGIETLKDRIKEQVWTGEIRADTLEVMINSRHQDALRRAREATLRTLDALRQETPLDLAAVDLRIATRAVGEIVGQTATEDLLDTIFREFCIGK